MTDDSLLDAIAIIGMSCRFPNSNNLKQFWNNLCQGVDCITQLTPAELHEAGVSETLMHQPKYVKRAAILEQVETFDADFFNYSDYEAALIDPQQRLFLQEVFHCFEDAGYDPYQLMGKVGVYAGSGFNMYFYNQFAQEDNPFTNSSEFALLLHSNGMDYLSTRVAYKFGYTGPAINIQTACSTSLVAVHEACLSLQNMQCDMAIAGGASLILPQHRGYLYEKGSLLSQDGYCRVFDKKASGTIFGSGVGVVLLKRFEDARRDQDKIYALIRGSSLNNDGYRKAGFTAPSIQGQSEVIAEALHYANVRPDDISYIEAHGTGTEMGDNIELSALNNIFGQSKKQTCIIGSVKTNVGHLLAASGIAGLIKTALMIHHKKMVPHLHFNEPIDMLHSTNGRFIVNTTYRPWSDPTNHYFSGVSSFGIGGTNVHMVLSANPLQSPQPLDVHQPTAMIFVASAKHPDSLKEYLKQLQTVIAAANPLTQSNMACALQLARHPFAYRYSFNLQDLPYLTPESISLTPILESPELGLMLSVNQTAYKFLQILMQFQPFLARQIHQCASRLPKTLTHIFELFEKTQVQHYLLDFMASYALLAWLIHVNIKPLQVSGGTVVEMAVAAINNHHLLDSIMMWLYECDDKQIPIDDVSWQTKFSVKSQEKDLIKFRATALTTPVLIKMNTTRESSHWIEIVPSSHQPLTFQPLSIENVYQSALNGLGQLWCLGVKIHFAALYEIVPHYKENELPLYPFQPQIHWIEKKSRNKPTSAFANSSELNERQLITILETLLGTSPIQSHDNFFDLGGHSLILARLIHTLEDQFNICIEMQTLFEYPSVSSLMGYLQEHTHDD